MQVTRIHLLALPFFLKKCSTSLAAAHCCAFFFFFLLLFLIEPALWRIGWRFQMIANHGRWYFLVWYWRAFFYRWVGVFRRPARWYAECPGPDPLVIIQRAGGEIHGDKEVQLLLLIRTTSQFVCFFCFWQKKEQPPPPNIYLMAPSYKKQFLSSARTFSSSLALPRMSCFPPFTPASTVTGERETASWQTVNISWSISLFTVKKKEEGKKKHSCKTS